MVLILEKDSTSRTHLSDQLVMVVLDVDVFVGSFVVRQEGVKVGCGIGGVVLVKEVPCCDDSGCWVKAGFEWGR
jgi:hypothetical protein